MLVTVIVACEVGFWVLLGAGLVARYVVRAPRLSVVLLLAVPLVDLVLLGATVLDLRAGATAQAAHGLAAAYLGFSVAFGHRTISAMDQRFAHRFAGGPPPERPPARGPARLRYEWAQWRRAALGWAVAVTLLVAAVVVIGDAARTTQLEAWARGLTVVLLAWLVLGPLRVRWQLARP